VNAAGHVACMKDRRGVNRVLVGKPEAKILGRPRHRCEDNIKTDIQEVGWEAWTELIWLRIRTGGGAVVNVVMNLHVPKNMGNFLLTS